MTKEALDGMAASRRLLEEAKEVLEVLQACPSCRYEDQKGQVLWGRSNAKMF